MRPRTIVLLLMLATGGQSRAGSGFCDIFHTIIASSFKGFEGLPPGGHNAAPMMLPSYGEGIARLSQDGHGKTTWLLSLPHYRTQADADVHFAALLNDLTNCSAPCGQLRLVRRSSRQYELYPADTSDPRYQPLRITVSAATTAIGGTWAVNLQVSNRPYGAPVPAPRKEPAKTNATELSDPESPLYDDKDDGAQDFCALFKWLLQARAGGWAAIRGAFHAGGAGGDGYYEMAASATLPGAEQLRLRRHTLSGGRGIIVLEAILLHAARKGLADARYESLVAALSNCLKNPPEENNHEGTTGVFWDVQPGNGNDMLRLYVTESGSGPDASDYELKLSMSML